MRKRDWMLAVLGTSISAVAACDAPAMEAAAPPPSGTATNESSSAPSVGPSNPASAAGSSASIPVGNNTAPARTTMAGVDTNMGAAPPSAGQAGSRSSSTVAGAASVSAQAGQPSAAQAGSSGGSATITAGAAGHGEASDTGGSRTAAACSSKAGKLRGKSNQTVMVDGQPRSFVYYAPENLDANKAVPLLIAPHGYTQSGDEFFTITKFNEVADREGIVAMFPDGAIGAGGPWTVGQNVCGAGAFVSGPGGDGDQKFVDAMIAFAQNDQCIDDEHMFMSGWSMGGYFSNHSGCLRDDIRAVGPHSGGSHDLSECGDKHKPVIIFHFDPDGLIDYECGSQARDRWVKQNGCQMESPDVQMVKGGRCEYYSGCPSDGQVAFCTFEIPPNHLADALAGHAWSGGAVHAFSIAETESASELAWSFFKKYAW